MINPNQVNREIVGTLSSGEDSTQRKWAEQELEWELAVDAALSELHRPLFSPSSSIDTITRAILDQAKKLTGSHHGYVSSIDPVTGDNLGHTLTELVEGQCSVPQEKRQIAFPRGADGRYAGLGGYALNTRQAFYTNAPATHPASSGVPAGHIPLQRFLSVPVLMGDELVGQIALANPDRDYTQRDLTAIQRLAEFYALAIQRMRAERALRASEAKYRELVQNANSIIFRMDIQGRVTFFNEFAECFFGYREEEILGHDVVGTIVPARESSGRDLAALIQDIVQHPERYANNENENMCRDGRRVWIAWTNKAILDDQGRLNEILCVGNDITQRVHAEQALQQSEELFRLLFELAPIGMAMNDVDGRYLRVNQAWCKTLGYTATELLGRNFAEITHPEDLAENVALREKVLRGEAPYFNMEKRFITKAGRTVHTLLRVTLVRDAHGQPAYFLGQVVDISERVRTETALRESQEQFSLFMDHLPAAAFIKDQDDHVVYANAYLKQAFGGEDWVGDSTAEHFPPEIAQAMTAADRQALAHGPMSMVEAMTDQNGIEHVYQTIKFPIQRQAKPTWLGGIALDITQQVRAEQALRDSHERFLTVLDGMAANIYAADLNTYEILFMNKHMREDFEAAAIGQACWKALRNEAGPCASCNQDQLLDAQGNPSGMHHWEGQNPLTGKWYINYDRAITWVDGRLARLQVSMDITGHKRLEEQLRQAQKMEAVGRLAGGIAHDFNNLLTAINGFAELMRSRLAPDDPLYEMADKVLGSGRRAADLTRQLLAFSRKQVVEPRVVDLNAVVADMDKMLRRIIGEDIQLQTIAGPGLWPVKVDPTQIEQIIVNLAVNARDAMPQGGRLTVETANVSPLHLPLPLRGQVPSPGQAGRGEEEGGGEYVLLAIGDTGVGMNEAVKAHLFEPFFTTKEEGKGTGLGLAMVYGIVQQSGGVIRIDSQEGLGAAVKIYLPRVAAAVTAPTGTEPATSLPAGSETVLLVEDDPGVRVLAARVLRRQGYCVWEAADGPQALRLAAEQGGPIHLLLSDVVMPGMSGRILADRLVAERPQLKILFTSGYADEALLHHGVLQSGAPFLQKPFTPEALARKVREVLDSRQ